MRVGDVAGATAERGHTTDAEDRQVRLRDDRRKANGDVTSSSSLSIS